VRVQPVSRGIPYFAGKNSPIECGELVEAPPRGWNLEASHRSGASGAISGPVRAMEAIKHTIKIAPALIVARDHEGRSSLGARRSVNGKQVRTMLPKANT
jgi:hypothetical protein